MENIADIKGSKVAGIIAAYSDPLVSYANPPPKRSASKNKLPEPELTEEEKEK